MFKKKGSDVFEQGQQQIEEIGRRLGSLFGQEQVASAGTASFLKGLGSLIDQLGKLSEQAEKAGGLTAGKGKSSSFIIAPSIVPQVSDWQSGSWDTDSTNILYPYSAKCLVGPAGTITLGIGTYIIYVKVTDNPEIPVLITGQLAIS